MARQQRAGFWSNLFGTAPTHDRFSVDELQVGDAQPAKLLWCPPCTGASWQALIACFGAVAIARCSTCTASC